MSGPTTSLRNPVRATDELILALDLYARFNGNPPGKTSEPISELSALLNSIGQSVRRSSSDYRNPNGVYMKIMNFRRFDPNYLSQGQVRLQRGGKEEAVVWKRFAHDEEGLGIAAQSMLDAAKSGGVESGTKIRHGDERMNDPGKHQLEDPSSNRSHRYEQPR